MNRQLTDSDYQRLLAFRDRLRRFLRWSEQHALAAGVTPAQHQLLLAIRGHTGGAPTIGDVAHHLLLRHHSAVGLVDRAQRVGLVERHVDGGDSRVVRLQLTRLGAERLAHLAAAHLDEISRFAAVGDLSTPSSRPLPPSPA
jgi:DNA-binding MarR family transcriptional regulator